jgi:hypothetical protein
VIDFQVVRVFVEGAVAKLKLSRMVPKLKIETYPRHHKRKVGTGWAWTLGLDLTWREGPGIGIGLGMTDFWLGWPRTQQIHYPGCVHESKA